MGKRKGKRGRTARNARKGINNAEPEEIVKAPHSFVINRGKLGKSANELLMNFRKIMEPFTASHLKVQKANVLKDFIHIAGPLNVTHMVIFTKSSKAMYLRIAKLPHGPTLTFQIKEYSLISDVISSQKKSLMYEKLFEHHPLLVLNNFSGEGMHFKLMTTTFQNMFPSINVNKTNLNTIRRCLLLNYNEDKTIDLRQYAIKVVPTGMSKAVKKLIQSKVPNLSQYQDIGDFLQKSGNLSESEVEMDTPANTVVLSQPISTRGNITSEKSAIRLFEMGPRIKLQLVKIEEGLMSGEVLFHEFIKKTPEEIKAIKAKIKAQKLLKEQRRAQQKKNVEKKKSAASKDNEANDDGNERAEDLEWYRREVGEEPDESILPISKISKKRKAASEEHKQRKKVKFSDDVNNKKYVKFQNKTQGKFQTKRNTNSKRIVKDRKRK
ncbi:Suppressor of SWI4 1 [Araneus ventricosus]|uniref:Suppressor of SWI4 1 n=1 Tax=Araneus ventricosus TaxID=182803 RepID=A0A4Y2G4F0_ARAVE|nr:Suppressor of SWI4 1 [Araneus ventricosus]